MIKRTLLFLLSLGLASPGAGATSGQGAAIVPIVRYQ